MKLFIFSNYISRHEFKIELYRKSCKKIIIPTTIRVQRKCLENLHTQTTTIIYMPWSFSSLKWNKLMHILMGNRRLGYRLAVWNCRKRLFLQDRSPSEKLVDIKNLLQHHDLHLLGVVESDLHSVSSRVRRANPLTTKDVIEKLHVDGYEIKLPLSWQSHGQARIFLYVKEGVHVNIRELSSQDSDLSSISCEIGLGREKKTCANFFYREWTGGVSGLGDMDSQLDRLTRQVKHWKSLFTRNRDVIILGDANLCAFKWGDNSYQYKSLADVIQNFLLETSSFQQVREFTRSEVACNGLVRSCIDHCYSDVPEKLSSPIVESAGDSDHLAVIVTKYAKAPNSKPQTVRKRSYKNFNVGSFLTDIYNSRINESVLEQDDIEEAAKVFEEMFSKILDAHAPIRTFQMRKNYLAEISAETKLLMAERNALKEEATATGNLILLQEHKLKSKEVKKAVEKDKKEYYENNFNEYVSVKTAWKTARNLLGINKNLSPTTIQNEGDMTSNPAQIANIFNKFFLRKVKLLREKTASVPVVHPVERLQNWVNCRGDLPVFKLKKINLMTLRKIIKRMKGKRSHGVDIIDSYSLKLAGPLIEESLMYLINLSISNQTFSARWKPQLIFPLHKKSKKFDVKNYRPVSHLVEVGKMAEYAIYDQVVEHFTENKLFHDNHHGSLSGHSTATALIQLVDMWIEASENTELSAALLLDQSAAYDLVDHQLLLQKLEVYNFDENSVQWFKSYLSERSQIVQVESKLSKPCKLEDHAVPQGSILGGLIFIIFSNDLPASSNEGESVMYVDDDTDVTHDPNPVQLQQKIQHKADCSASWLKDNRMCVAGEKSKLLIIGTSELRSSKLTDPIVIEVDNMEVEETKSEKLLGVIINNKLTWQEHLHGETWRKGDENATGLIPQLSQRVGILKRMSKYMNKKRLELFTNSIFYSKLNYCLPVFGHVFGLEMYKYTSSRARPFTKEDNRKIQVLQNKVMRLITGMEKATPTTTLLKLTKSLSVQQMIVFQTLTMVHKVIHTAKPAYLANRMKFRTDEDNRKVPPRSQGMISIVTKKLSTSRGGFVYRGSKLFNSLPNHLRTECNLKQFKKGVKEWVIATIRARPE